MQIVEHHISVRQAAWAKSPLFEMLRRERCVDPLREFARGLAFWPLVFQDVLRLLSQTVDETELRVIARHHAAEDRDHDLWFLHDLAAMGVRIPDANDIFRRDHEPARLAAYAIVAEALKATTGAEKIVVLLALESTGHVFFTETSKFVRRMRIEGLKYFSEDHLLVEQGHALFESRAKELLRRITFDDAQRRRAIDVADACFDAIETMVQRILSAMASSEWDGGRAEVGTGTSVASRFAADPA